MPVGWKEALTAPRSVALVGASKEEGSLNYRLMVGFLNQNPKCKVYLVNPKWDEFNGHRFHKSLSEIEDEVDVACIMTSAKTVKSVLRECVEKRVPCADIISAGFGETGHEIGKNLQREISELIGGSNTRVLGPNALGVVSPPNNVVLDVYPDTVHFEKGNVSVIAQSNGVAHLLVEKLLEMGIGTRYVFCLGNQIDLNISDVLELLMEDDDTHIVICYVESLKDIQKFKDVTTSALRRSRPIITIKGGRTEAGKLAVLSHTASLGGSQNSFVAFGRQTNLLLVNTIQEALDTTVILESAIRPKVQGIAAVLNSGGFCALLADRCGETGINLPKLSPETTASMNRLLQDYSKESHILPVVKNPMDVGFFAFDWRVYLELVRLAARDPNVGVVVSSMLDHDMLAEQRAKLFIEISKECREMGKLFVCIWAASYFNDQPVLKMLSQNLVPTFSSPEQAADAIKQLFAYGAQISREQNSVFGGSL